MVINITPPRLRPKLAAAAAGCCEGSDDDDDAIAAVSTSEADVDDNFMIKCIYFDFQ